MSQKHGCVVQVIECLPSKLETLTSKPSTAKKKEKKKLKIKE
jgi:hypothetical protein